MASRVVMPKLTDTMIEGVLLKWYKNEGDPVESGDVLAEIETDKAVMDLEAYASGILRKVLVLEGTTVPAGDLLAIIGGKEEEISVEEMKKTPGMGSREQNPEAMPKETVEQIRGETKIDEMKIKASPLAKKIAKERGIDLSEVKGSGPGGRIVEKDLKDLAIFVKQREIIDAYSERKPFSQIRKAIIRSMAQSKIPVPHFYVTSDIDMEKVFHLQKELLELENGFKITITDILIKASAMALIKVSQLNVSFREDHLEYHKGVHIGVAVGLEDGVITPVIRNCEIKTLGQIAQEIKPLIQRARERKLLPEEYSGATFSISNLGQYDVHHFIAIITPPEAAVLAVGSMRDEPVVRNGNIVAGKRMQVTLSCDHRMIDGVAAARFLQELKKVIETPSLLIL